MGGLGPEEVARVARLARLALGPEEAARLAADLEAITATFAGLADHAATLPPAPEEPPGELRADEAAAPDAEEAAAILAAAPRVDPSGAVRVPRRRGA